MDNIVVNNIIHNIINVIIIIISVILIVVLMSSSIITIIAVRGDVLQLKARADGAQHVAGTLGCHYHHYHYYH